MPPAGKVVKRTRTLELTKYESSRFRKSDSSHAIPVSGHQVMNMVICVHQGILQRSFS